MQLLFQPESFRDTVYSVVTQSKTPLVDALTTVFIDLNEKNADPVHKNVVVDEIKKKNNFDQFIDQNPHEFMIIILNRISEECANDSVTKLFGFMMSSTIITGHGTKTTRIEDFLDLTVDIENSLTGILHQYRKTYYSTQFKTYLYSKTVIDCINKLLSPEQMNVANDNQYYDEERGHNVDAIKTSFFCSLPEYLTIHLKRFKYDPETRTTRKLSNFLQIN